MKVKVEIRNPKTGELKQVKVGWSWTIFFFGNVFGIPLFMRRLFAYAWAFVGLFLLHLIFYRLSQIGDIVISLLNIGLVIWLAIKGNELTVKNYLNHGWVFAEENSDAVAHAKRKWNISPYAESI